MSVLDTLRKLLSVKRSPISMPEVASYCKLHKAHVLEVIHRNKHLLGFDKRGRIVAVKVRSKLRDQLWEEGKYWRVVEGNYGGTKEMHFKNAKLHDQLKEKRWYGGYGDSHQVEVVVLTDENVKALREAGLVPSEEIELDDRLWEEGD